MLTVTHGTYPEIKLCGAPTEQISEYVDHQSLVNKIPLYLKDTIDFLNKLATLATIPSECILLTLNVSSFYTDTPHTEGWQDADKP